MKVGARVTTLGSLFKQWGRSWLPPRAPRLVGLDIGSSAMTLVQLENSHPNFSLTRFAFRWLTGGLVQDGAIVHRQRLAAELHDLVAENRLSGQPVVLSVSGPSVMVKRIRISGVQSGDLEGYLEWEGHRYVSHPAESVYLDHQVLGSNGVDELDVLLAVAKRAVVEERQSLGAAAGLEPVGCDVDGLALANMASLSGCHSCATHLNVNLGSGGCTMVALDRGIPLFVRDVSWEDAHSEESTDLNMDTINGGSESNDPDRPGEYADYPDVRSLAEEIRRNLNFLCEKGAPTRMEHIQLSGNGARVGLCKKLAGELSLPVTLLNPFTRITIRDLQVNQDQMRRFGLLAGVAVGLAVRRDCYA